jgi:hypothetical protein
MRNRPQNQQKHYCDDPPIIMRNTGPSLCAAAALRHLCLRDHAKQSNINSNRDYLSSCFLLALQQDFQASQIL